MKFLVLEDFSREESERALARMVLHNNPSLRSQLLATNNTSTAAKQPTEADAERVLEKHVAQAYSKSFTFLFDCIGTRGRVNRELSDKPRALLSDAELEGLKVEERAVEMTGSCAHPLCPVRTFENSYCCVLFADDVAACFPEGQLQRGSKHGSYYSDVSGEYCSLITAWQQAWELL